MPILTLDQMRGSLDKIIALLDELSRAEINPGGDEDLRVQVFYIKKIFTALEEGWDHDYSLEERAGYLKIAINHHVTPMLNFAHKMVSDGRWQVSQIGKDLLIKLGGMIYVMNCNL